MLVQYIVVVATSDRRGQYLGACAPFLHMRIGGKRDLSVVMLVELLREQIRPPYSTASSRDDATFELLERPSSRKQQPQQKLHSIGDVR